MDVPSAEALGIACWLLGVLAVGAWGVCLGYAAPPPRAYPALVTVLWASLARAPFAKRKGRGLSFDGEREIFGTTSVGVVRV